MKPITLTLTLKKLLLFGIPALAIIGFFVVGFIVATGELSNIKKELSDVEKELSRKVSKKELLDTLAKHDILTKEKLLDTDSPSREKMTLAFVPKEPYEEVIIDYFAAESWQDRLAFVLHPNTTEPRMKRHYGYSKPGDLEVTNIIPIDGKNKIGVGEYVELEVHFKDNQDMPQWHHYYVKHTPDGYKIDWEASLQKNPMTWKAYMVQRPTKPMLFRVAASLDTYYNYEFRDAHNNYLSIQFNIGTLSTLYGYVRRESKSGKRMYEILKDGEYHYLIVKIRFLAGDDPRSNTVLIDELVSEDWTIRESQEFAQ